MHDSSLIFHNLAFEEDSQIYWFEGAFQIHKTRKIMMNG